MRPITRLQLHLSASTPVQHVASFIRSELNHRAVYISTLLDSNASFWGSSVHAAGEVRDELLHIQANGGTSCLHLGVLFQDHLNKFLLQHRSLVQEQREAGCNVLQGEHLLDKIQYNVTGLQLLLVRLHAVNAALYPNLLQTSSSEEMQYQRGLTVSTCPMDALLRQVVDDLRPFAVEKFGVAPPMELHLSTHSSHKFTVLGPPALLTYVLTEMCKNSMAAMISKYTALGVDDAPAIQLVLASSPSRICVRFSDTAGGYKNVAGCKTKFDYFASTVSRREETNYQYSREFGAPISGWGIGLVRSALFAKYFDGEVSLLSTPGHGTVVQASFERSGDAGSDLW